MVLPQAFRLALPATINQFVMAFMETSLVVVVGFVELLAAGNTAYKTGEWKFAYVEVYAFISPSTSSSSSVCRATARISRRTDERRTS